MDTDAADDYDVSLFSMTEKEESDKCGRMARGHPPLLRLSTGQGVFWIPYHGICGLDEFKDRFTIHFRATLGWEVEGKTVAMEGCWLATVTGLRLDPILNHLGMGQRVALNAGGTPSDSSPYVSRIDLEPVEPDTFEAERA